MQLEFNVKNIARVVVGVLAMSWAMASAGCAHRLLDVDEARIEVVDEALARQVLTDAGYVVTGARSRVLTAEEGRALLNEMGVGFLANDDADGHAVMTDIKAENDTGTASITLVTTTKPCWPESDQTKMDNLTGQAMWGKGTREVDTWCFSKETLDIDRDCAVQLMKRVVAASR